MESCWTKSAQTAIAAHGECPSASRARTRSSWMRFKVNRSGGPISTRIFGHYGWLVYCGLFGAAEERNGGDANEWRPLFLLLQI
jgi:hypothetical protein